MLSKGINWADLKMATENRYLNLDEQKFYPDLDSLVSCFAVGCCVLNSKLNDHGQRLVVGSIQDFTMHEAIAICRKLTGVDE